jgi:hypothetical protein
MLPIVHSAWFVAMALVAFAAAPSVPKTSVSRESHRLKLKAFVIPPNGAVGLLIAARVNGGPPLRLLLDSGSQFLVLDRKAAARSNCTGGSSLDLVGAGGAPPKEARTVKANTVETGDMVFRKVSVVILDGQFLDGVDGVMPLVLFADYMIRLDFPARSLDLMSYSDEQPLPSGNAYHAILNNNLLFVRGTLNEKYEGYFLLDTGASYNAISTNLARQMNSAAALSAPLPLQGGTTRLYGSRVTEIVRFRVGSSDLRTDPTLAVDLSLTSRYHNLEVSGLVGYPALRASVLTLNFRDGLVQIERK